MRGLFLISCFCLFSLFSTQAQEITGLWEVKSVSMGERSMTPVAKWFRIAEDGTYAGGNGWQQNSEGTYTYDKQQQRYFPKEARGIIDPAGAFTITFTDAGMEWTRQEDGVPVKVQLVRIAELPKTPADQLSGLWGLVKFTEKGQDITATIDPEGQHYRFFRWDRLYNERNVQGQRESGYWHMNAHAPEVTLIPHAAAKEAESWRVSLTHETLTLTGISENNQGKVMHYKRLSEFPK